MQLFTKCFVLAASFYESAFGLKGLEMIKNSQASFLPSNKHFCIHKLYTDRPTCTYT